MCRVRGARGVRVEGYDLAMLACLALGIPHLRRLETQTITVTGGSFDPPYYTFDGGAPPTLKVGTTATTTRGGFAGFSYSFFFTSLHHVQQFVSLPLGPPLLDGHGPQSIFRRMLLSGILAPRRRSIASSVHRAPRCWWPPCTCTLVHRAGLHLHLHRAGAAPATVHLHLGAVI